ncbi:MAG TPA: MFS transporter [Candidatus Avibacteroides excrementipullorum]|jgi:FHS family L-fucose permease-like MFS transporter|nr:MFS transporter [Candidatus Avibacteroides excrementipullorum]
MSNSKKQWGAIVIMIALFAMIAFVTNLCSPMAVIVKNDFGASNVLAQIGNYGNFIAYLVMGIPAGMLISKFGYKKTALIGLFVGIVGVLVQWMSGHVGKESAFLVYLIGAFISGFTMCILNCVVNPMLNLLGGGGNKGNQLIQIGGVFNSAAAVAVYIIMGALIGDAAKAHIADATPALMIALGVFVVGFIVLLFTKVEEPEQAPVDVSLIKGAMKYRHFVLGVVAIFLYMSVEVGTPTYMLLYLTETSSNATPGIGMNAEIAGLIVAVYWLMMLIGRFIGGAIGGKISSRAMISTAATISIVLILFGMFAPATLTTNVPGIDWANLNVIWTEVPVSVFAFILVGLCTSVMWGGIFNMAVEGLGKYTAIASGIFMTMVCGCAVMVALQGWVADLTSSYMTSYWVVLFSAAYILFYALIGSKPSAKSAR